MLYLSATIALVVALAIFGVGMIFTKASAKKRAEAQAEKKLSEAFS